MERIAAIVEGHLEAHFMNESYPKVLVQRCLPNGDDVDLDLIIEAITDQLEVIDGGVRRIVIMLDRERRQMTSEEIAAYIRSQLVQHDPGRLFYIGVADREAENWILADREMIAAKFGLEQYGYCGDGIAGKSRLAAITLGDLAPRDKARLMKAISPTRAGPHSASLHHFVSQIDFPWYWASS